MIRDNRYLVIFGGRNDTHKDLEAQDTSKFSALNDLLLFDTVQKSWTCFGVYGFRPSPRWNCAMAVSDSREQIYLFGGSNYEEGSCSNEIYCLDYNASGVLNHLSQIRQCNDEANILTRKWVKLWHHQQRVKEQMANHS